MANINLSQNSYVDYIASMFFNALNVKNVSFSPKVVEVDGKKTILIHVEGVQVSSGVVVNLDMWPRNEATEEDIQKLPKQITDMKFRIGYWAGIDENGEHTLREGTPKWLSFFNGDKEVYLSGDKRKFDE